MRYSFGIFFFLLLCSCTYNEIIPVCEPDEQVFLDLVQPIIEDKCIACHNESSSRPSRLTTYDGVIFAVNNHSLYDWIVSRQMPPEGIQPLTDAEINVFTKWINCE